MTDAQRHPPPPPRLPAAAVDPLPPDRPIRRSSPTRRSATTAPTPCSMVVNLDPVPAAGAPCCTSISTRSACRPTGRTPVRRRAVGGALRVDRARRRTSGSSPASRVAHVLDLGARPARGELRSHRARAPAGTSGPCSTRSWCGGSTTATTTAPATWRASRPSSTTSQWLGVDCLWLLPFYQSPLRDGGYDISDFWTVLPEYGDLADAVELVEEAHKRGIADHRRPGHEPHQSDQHPWFLESRQDRTNPKADWYVWSDDDSRLPRRPGHLRRHREVQLDLRRPAGPVLLAPLLLPPARPQLRQPRGGRRHARRGPLLARHRPRRLPPRRRPLPVRAGGHQLARTCPRPTSTCGGCARRSIRSTRAGCCWPRPTSGPRTSSSTSATATSATCASTSR